MDFKDIVHKGFDQFLEELKKSLETLTPEERRFQPSPDSHHIDFVVWHMARVEDDWVQRFAQQNPTVWQRDDWHTRFGMPERESGFGYSPEQVRDLPTFDMDQMLEYFDAVRVDTNAFLDAMSESDLSTEPHPRRPGVTLMDMWGHVMIEEAEHLGQVAYIRGIRRGLDK